MDLPFCPEVGGMKESLSMPWIHPGEIILIDLKMFWENRQNAKRNVEGNFLKSWHHFFLIEIHIN